MPISPAAAGWCSRTACATASCSTRPRPSARLQYLAQLWGYRVKLVEQDVEGARVLKEHEALPMP